MKKLIFITFSVFGIGLASCSGQHPQEHNRVSVSPFTNNVNIQADENNASFDVNALSTLVQKSTDPKVLESSINDPSTNINNLDLDKDGHIDFLTVTETGQNEIQINDAAVNPPVLVARMTVTPDNTNQTADLQIHGTPAYCGPNYYYYQPHISFGTMLFMAYLLRPHPYYYPMYGYGHYPNYYTSRRTVVRTSYRPTTSAYNSSRGGYTGNRGSYNRSYNSPGRSSLSTPTSSQRSFNTRNTNRSVGSGGFGNSSSRSYNRSYTPSRSSGFGGGSRSSYRPSGGGSRRSFGRRR